jgi:hypothetical protein
MQAAETFCQDAANDWFRKQKITSQIFFRIFFIYLLFFSDPRLNMLRRDVEELKEKTWELDSTTRNNLGTHVYLVTPFFQEKPKCNF